MRYIVCPHAQGTPEWKADRAGKVTGSRAAVVLDFLKNGSESANRRDYRYQLVTERLTGLPAEDVFVNDAMRWGTEQEPFARMEYEAQADAIVEEAGFLYLPDLAAGCSVDGLVGDAGLFEAKCPKTATHIGYIQAGRLPPTYEPQVIHNLWVTGREWADFVSYDPRLPENLRYFCVRVQRDEEKIKAHEAAVLKFLAEVDELEQSLRKRAA